MRKTHKPRKGKRKNPAFGEKLLLDKGTTRIVEDLAIGQAMVALVNGLGLREKLLDTLFGVGSETEEVSNPLPTRENHP